MTTPQENSSTTRAFVYLRISSPSQQLGDGFERQHLACEQYARLNNIEIVEVFREQVMGKSELEERPALSALFAALEENGVKTVLIEKLDRLARDLMVQETIITDMRKSGYTLLSAMEPDLCSDDPSRVMMRQIFGAIAQYDKQIIVLKTRAARERIRARGERCEGRRPFGFRLGEAETLAQMRIWRAEGDTYAQIADKLNADEIPSRTGKPWHTPTVHKILMRLESPQVRA